ncbi:hypothetical protein B0T25DRAFT_569548 [Lasiosphaeria hispida]|uniref:Uncharacterized protein n=1 Tax=Lasiosphaeria hispida TaxID=260671 RepID=A0AAJ0MBT4_9PEZI|nr:hypothetical protein B0T25DRAFT_569548 [Lasiosphaeria hispida]
MPAVLNLRVEVRNNNILSVETSSPSEMEPREAGDGEHQARRGHRQGPRPWYTARVILGAFSIMLSIALLGLGIKMSVTYDDAPLIHVSFAFVGFTAATSMAWQSFEFAARCARRNHRGIYAGAHVGVHVCLCFACFATVGYMCFWVSLGDRWKSVEVHGHPIAYSPLYHIGIVIVIVTAVLLLVHFLLSILACQDLRKKDNADIHTTFVTVRYDGVGPTGTARPLSDDIPEAISLPPYTRREAAGQGASSPAGRSRSRAEAENSDSTNSVSPVFHEKSSASGPK